MKVIESIGYSSIVASMNDDTQVGNFTDPKNGLGHILFSPRSDKNKKRIKRKNIKKIKSRINREKSEYSNKIPEGML